MLLGSDDENIGFAPLVALALPIAKAAALQVGTQVVGGLFKGKAPPPPPCSFGQKLARIFGSKPNCR